jgi:hypothetical protein
VSDTNPSLIRLTVLDTTLLSDALDAYGLPGGTGALVAQGGTAQLCGRVRTVQLAPVNPRRGAGSTHRDPSDRGGTAR